MRLIDVRHLGRPNVIACWDLDGVLIDPGPESSLETLIASLGGEPPRAILLTHIHLDHAAAVGAMVERWPELPVYVHRRGAPHLVDPTRLLASAQRVYGDKLESLWGRIVPVPETNVHPIDGGERVFGLDVAYTPGHASHHVCFFDPGEGVLFAGDLAGCRIPPTDVIIPPTPPPDIDVELWAESIEKVRDFGPTSLALTHFGPVVDPDDHLARTIERLRYEAEAARDASRSAYDEGLRRRIEAEVDESRIAELLQAVPIEYQWNGLHRYWGKRSVSS